MRISDWSSDVCSSDLRKGGVERARLTQFISEIQMVDRRRAVVEHSSLDKPLPKDLHHQIDITLRRTGRDGDVMKTFNAIGQWCHTLSPRLDRKSTRLNSSH